MNGGGWIEIRSRLDGIVGAMRNAGFWQEEGLPPEAYADERIAHSVVHRRGILSTALAKSDLGDPALIFRAVFTDAQYAPDPRVLVLVLAKGLDLLRRQNADDVIELDSLNGKR